MRFVSQSLLILCIMTVTMIVVSIVTMHVVSHKTGEQRFGRYTLPHRYPRRQRKKGQQFGQVDRFRAGMKGSGPQARYHPE
jgi:hypothetical protein